ncbi:MAG: FKBP-type peptidyl-prolyl cis-trans isomerase [Maribacter sp.]
MIKYTLFAAFLFLIVSCNDKKTDQIDFTTQNEEEILNYISENNLTTQKSSSGLHYVINDPGTGAQPSANSTVTVAYKGYFLNKSVFDESDSAGISFGLQQVIPGWTEGISYFKEGGNGILLVPAHLGYGNFDTRGIPGGSVLIFEVELISVN